MKRSFRWLMFLIAAITSTGMCFADELRRNPFEHPKLDAAAPEQASRRGIISAEDLRISAILIAGEKSLVNVNGTILGLGEEQDGYVLRAVDEEAAVFSMEGRMITISLFEQRADQDED